MTQLHPKPARLAGSSSHGDWLDETLTFPRQADPPLSGGVEHNSAGDTAISHGGADGLSSFERPSMWELLTDTADDFALASPLTKLLEKLEDSPAFRRGQVADALADLQYALEKVSHAGDGNNLVSLPAGTVVVLAHALLRHQP